MKHTELIEKDTTANPAPLGLLGFGMTTILLNLHNAGFYPMDTMILGMGIFFGGIAQLIAGVLEWKKGNTFGTTAFCSYGAFWLTLVALIVLPKTGAAAAPTAMAMAAYLAVWGLFTLGMFVGTLRLNTALKVIFSTLTILFFLLAAHKALDAKPLGEQLGRIAGYEGIFCGASAFYAALAQVLNEVYGRVVLPLGDKKK